MKTRGCGQDGGGVAAPLRRSPFSNNFFAGEYPNMPPKRKGRVPVYPAAPSLPPGQRTIAELTANYSRLEVTRSAEVTTGGVMVDPGETTLSPPDPRTPPVPVPRDSSSPVSAILVPNGELATAAGTTAGSGRENAGLEETGEGMAGLQAASLNLDSVSTMNAFNGEDFFKFEPEAGNALFPKPEVVSMDALWELITKMGMALYKVAQQQTNVTQKIGDFTHEYNAKYLEHQQKILRLEEQVKKSQDMQAAMLKDRIAINRKLEQLENKSRNLNLRFINFPKVMGEQPRVTLRKYMVEILKIAPENIPALNKVYFMPHVRPRGEEAAPELDLANLTTFLENSMPEVIERSTLLVSFIYSQDLSLVMRNYFSNMRAEFMGKAVQVFPDLAQATQERRRGFLSMRQDARLLGASFVLRYPCRCILKLDNVTYVFFVPEQMKELIENRKRLLPNPPAQDASDVES